MEISKARLTGGSFIKGNINAVVQEDLGFGAGLSELITKTLSGVQNYQAAKEAEKAKQLKDDEDINRKYYNDTILSYQTNINNIDKDTTLSEEDKIIKKKVKYEDVFGDRYFVQNKTKSPSGSGYILTQNQVTKEDFDKTSNDISNEKIHSKYEDRHTFIGENQSFWKLSMELERKKILGEYDNDLLKQDKRAIEDIENNIQRIFQQNGLDNFASYRTLTEAKANMNEDVFNKYKTSLAKYKKEVNDYMNSIKKDGSIAGETFDFYNKDGEPTYFSDDVYKRFVKTEDGMNSLKSLIQKGYSKALLIDGEIDYAANQMKIESTKDKEDLLFAETKQLTMKDFSNQTTSSGKLNAMQKFYAGDAFGGKAITEYSIDMQRKIADFKTSLINDIYRENAIIAAEAKAAYQDKLMGFGTNISESYFNQLSAGNKRAIISELASNFTYDVENNPNSFIGISTEALHKIYPMLAYIKDPRITRMVESRLGVIGNIGKVTQKTIDAERIAGGSGLDNQLKALNAQAIVYLNGGNMAKLVETIKTGSKNGVNFSIFESAEAQLKSAYSNGEVSQIGNAVQLLKMANQNGYSIKSELLEKIETVQTYMNVDIETAATQVFKNKNTAIDGKTKKIITKFIGDKGDSGIVSAIVNMASTSESKIVASIGKNTLENHMKTLINTDIAKDHEEAFDIAMEHIDNNSISGYKDQPYKYIKPDITKENISNIQFNIAASLNAQAQKSGGKVGIYPSAIIIKANDPFNANTTWNVSYQTSNGVTKASRPYTTEELQKLGSVKLKIK